MPEKFAGLQALQPLPLQPLALHQLPLQVGRFDIAKEESEKHYSLLFVGAAEGAQCTQNADCHSNLLCDGNLKTCRKVATSMTYDPDFCGSNGILCQNGEGDCDADSDCEGSLKCGNDNCPAQYVTLYNWSTEVDCCYLPPTSTITTTTPMPATTVACTATRCTGLGGEDWNCCGR